MGRIRIRKSNLYKLTKKDILVRIKNQISESKKKELSDFVVENINLNNTFLKIDEILKILAKL